MKYSVQVWVELDAADAKTAIKQVESQFSNEGVYVGSATFVDDIVAGNKPVISKELATFMKTEVQSNDNDPSGWDTNLDYIDAMFEQMPDDLIEEFSDYEGDDPEFVDKLKKEFDLLYDRYGGLTSALELLNA